MNENILEYRDKVYNAGVVETGASPFADCAGCAFEAAENPYCYNMLITCQSSGREDGRDIIWIELK